MSIGNTPERPDKIPSFSLEREKDAAPVQLRKAFKKAADEEMKGLSSSKQVKTPHKRTSHFSHISPLLEKKAILRALNRVR